MRLSDLLGATVLDHDGRELGHVHDVEMVADGPTLGPFGPTLRVHRLVVGRGSIGKRLGLDRDSVRGPWLLKVIFRRRQLLPVPWHDVERAPDGTLHVTRARPTD
jgi:hypothetical protein